MSFAIHVKNVVKTYKLYSNNMDRLKEALLPRSGKKYSTDFQALSNISFTVAKGDIVGIVGTNGSGKSTILKIICGVLQPTSGSVEVNGRVSALLELGAGFNMEYTGIENIRLNGMMQGFSYQQIEEKIPAILEFAEIGNFAYQRFRLSAGKNVFQRYVCTAGVCDIYQYRTGHFDYRRSAVGRRYVFSGEMLRKDEANGSIRRNDSFCQP